MPHRIVICDDNKNIRAFLKMILSKHPDIEVVAEGTSGLDAVSLCKSLSPDLLLVDVQMDDTSDGIDAVARVREFDKKVKIIVLTVYSDDDFVINSFRNGADNFILKDLSAEGIIKIIKDTLNGEGLLSQMVATKLKNYVMKDCASQRVKEEAYYKSAQVLSALTKTELEILISIREGKTRNDISRERVIEEGTVKTHITNILKKLQCRKTSEAIRELDNIGFFDYAERLNK